MAPGKLGAATTLRTLCGLLAPLAFVAGWLVNGLRTSGYDPMTEAISQLARVGAPTRVSMTVVFVVFGALAPLWAPVLARALRAPLLLPVVVVAGASTLAVAALPLTREGGTTQDSLHAVAAAIGYAAMALTPIIAAWALYRLGHRRAAGGSLVVGLVSLLCLVATVAVERSGALQRLGLGVVDLWHVVAATIVLLRWTPCDELRRDDVAQAGSP